MSLADHFDKKLVSVVRLEDGDVLMSLKKSCEDGDGAPAL